MESAVGLAEQWSPPLWSGVRRQPARRRWVHIRIGLQDKELPESNRGDQVKYICKWYSTV